MTRPDLRLVDPDTGELAPDAPSYSEALAALGKLETAIRMLERDLAGKRLRIAELEADREAKALDDPLRAEVELIHAAWKVACRRRRPLHVADRERISRAVKKLGLRRCLAAVAGAAYDPNRSKPRRNGHRETYNDLELVFREYANVARFAARVPDGWDPDPERLAAIGEPSADWIAERLR